MARGGNARAVVLVVFALALAIQALLHAHLQDDRHHAPGCHDPHQAVRQGPPSAAVSSGPDAASGPAGGAHGACARCVTPSATLRPSPAAVAGADGSADAAIPRTARALDPAARLGYELRGPPRA